MRRFETAVPLAAGGTAEVFKAFDSELGRWVALKLLRHDDPLHVERLLLEARAQARVDHPNICKIYEVGERDGRPFIAMQYIEGETLGEAAPNLTLEERVRLIAQVADAVHAAHQVGLIHRDLKPGNVMVERDDEGELRPYVLDFGLAHDEINPGGLTVTGQVLGTAAYMSPEQARGDRRRADRRTDVWGLGATLYDVLLGRPPFDGNSISETLIGILQKEVRAPRSLDPHFQRDLQTIVLKCLEKPPERRYVSARALASDLRRFLDGDVIEARPPTFAYRMQTLGRKNPMVLRVLAVALVGFVLGGVKYTLDVRAERSQAIAARLAAEQAGQEAEDNRAQVEGLMDFMLGDLREKLTPIGRLDLLGMVAEQARAYYQQRPVDWTATDDARRRAVAHTNLGDVLWGQGDYAGALVEYRASQAIAARLAEEPPSDIGRSQRLASSVMDVGKGLDATGDLAAALVEYRTSRTILEGLALRAPDDTSVQRDLSIAHEHVGRILLALGDHDAALAAYRASRALRQRLVHAEPENTVWLGDLAWSHQHIGDVARDRGDRAAALAEYRAAAAIHRGLVRTDPNDTAWQRRLSLNHRQIGIVLSLQRNLRGAEREHRESEAIMARLVERDPTNVIWQNDLAAADLAIGGVLAAAGDTQRAQVHLSRCLENFETYATVANDFYNAACCAALVDDLDQAFAMLAALSDKGYRNVAWMQQDPDLESLHSDPRWKAAIEGMQRPEATGVQPDAG